MPSKLGRSTTQRMAVIKNQTSELLWYGQIETTLDRAKSVQSVAEKLLTKAINSYDDVVKVTKKKVNLKNETVDVPFENDGAKKLAARRYLMANLVDLQEQRDEKESKTAFKSRVKDINHPLVERIFNEYAPKYAARKAELGQGGGYTRIIPLGQRRGDAAEKVILQLI